MEAYFSEGWSITVLQGIMGGVVGALEAPFGCNLRTKMNCHERPQQTHHPARLGTEKPDSPGSSDKGKGLHSSTGAERQVLAYGRSPEKWTLNKTQLDLLGVW